mmetsp:Transcript_158817/g.509130  ORF Transcript_158817/g.509130 Transcript_158817/m.509130 type:complete len:307 (+) Transcript_158817:1867-2787(+)
MASSDVEYGSQQTLRTTMASPWASNMRSRAIRFITLVGPPWPAVLAPATSAPSPGTSRPNAALESGQPGTQTWHSSNEVIANIPGSIAEVATPNGSNGVGNLQLSSLVTSPACCPGGPRCNADPTALGSSTTGEGVIGTNDAPVAFATARCACSSSLLLLASGPSSPPMPEPVLQLAAPCAEVGEALLLLEVAGGPKSSFNSTRRTRSFSVTSSWPWVKKATGRRAVLWAFAIARPSCRAPPKAQSPRNWHSNEPFGNDAHGTISTAARCVTVMARCKPAMSPKTCAGCPSCFKWADKDCTSISSA